MKHIYIIGEIDTVSEPSRVVKIGIAKDAEARLKQIQTGSSQPYILLNCCFVRRADSLEQSIHKLLEPYRVKGEWFKLPTDILLAAAAVMHSADMDCDCKACTFKVSRNVIAKHRPELLMQHETYRR